jgi:hypothetical protein
MIETKEADHTQISVEQGNAHLAMKFLTITPRQRNLEELISKRTSSKKTSPFCFLFCNHGYNAIIV